MTVATRRWLARAHPDFGGGAHPIGQLGQELNAPPLRPGQVGRDPIQPPDGQAELGGDCADGMPARPPSLTRRAIRAGEGHDGDDTTLDTPG
jgi:hypothetical protein